MSERNNMQILVGGSCKELTQWEIIRAVRFFGNELLGQISQYSAKIYVDLFLKSQNPTRAGGVVLPFYGRPIELLHMKLQTSQSRVEQLLTLAHETVHVSQIVTGRFMSSRDKHGRLHVVWNGSYRSSDSLTDENSPWEREANELELPLFEKYLNTFP